MKISHSFIVLYTFFAAPQIQAQTTGQWSNSLAAASDGKLAVENNREVQEKAKAGDEQLDRLFSALENANLSYSGNASLNVFRGLGLRANYKGESGPAFYGRHFQRVDQWSLGLGANVLELAGVQNTIQLKVEPSLRLRYYQFFDSPRDAANPLNMFLPIQIPRSAEDILTKMKPGDLMLLEGNLPYILGYGHLFSELSNHLRLTPSVGRTVHGQFRLYVFRGESNTVRIRLSATRSIPTYGKISLGAFDILDFGWGFVTKALERALGIGSLVEFVVNRFDQDQFLADYILDIRDMEIKNIVDDLLFDHVRRLGTLFKVANPFLDEDELRIFLEENLAELNRLAFEELQSLKPKVAITFYGSNFANGNQKSAEFGIRRLWRNKGSTTQQDSRLSRMQFDEKGNQQKEYYFFPSWHQSIRRSAQIVGADKKDLVANIVYRTDDKYKIQSFHGIGFYVDEINKSYTQKEHHTGLHQIKRNLPPSIFQKLLELLDANSWFRLEDTRQNVRITTRYFIHANGLRYLMDISANDIKSRIVTAILEVDHYIDRKHFISVDPSAHELVPQCSRGLLSQLGIPAINGVIGPYTYKYCKDILLLANKMADSFNASRTPEERHETFASLSSNELFRFLGVGILFDMIPEDIMENVANFEITFHSSSLSQPLSFAFGQSGDREFYELLLQIVSETTENEPDLRIPGEFDNHTTRVMHNH